MKRKTIKYATIRSIILILAYIFFWNIAYYLLPTYYQEDQFSFIGEMNVFFRISLVFTLLYLIFLGFETFKFNKKKDYKLRNTALNLVVLSLIITVILLYLNQIY